MDRARGRSNPCGCVRDQKIENSMSTPSPQSLFFQAATIDLAAGNGLFTTSNGLELLIP